MSTTQLFRDPEQALELYEYFLKRGQLRNHALVVMDIHIAGSISNPQASARLFSPTHVHTRPTAAYKFTEPYRFLSNIYI